MTTMNINGQAAQFARMGDLLVSTTPVTRGQYHGDTEVDRAGEWVTELTRPEVLSWCRGHGVRLLADEEWAAAVKAGIIGEYVLGCDVWEEIGPVGDRRVLRGGGWFNLRPWSRVNRRIGVSPDHRRVNFGFRVCLSSTAEDTE